MYVKLEGHTCLEYNIRVLNIIERCILSSKVILDSNIIDESSSKVILVSNIFRYSNNTLDALRQTTALSYEIDFDLVAALVSYIVLNKPVSQIYLFLFDMIDINLNKFCLSCCIKIVPTKIFNSIQLHDSMTLS